MAECTTFSECVPNPIEGLDASGRFTSLSSLLIYSMNLTLYVIYAVLIVWVSYSLFKGVYTLMGASDATDSYEKLKTSVSNAVFAAVGIVLIFSMRFFFAVALDLVGVPDSENIFNDNMFNNLFR